MSVIMQKDKGYSLSDGYTLKLFVIAVYII